MLPSDKIKMPFGDKLQDIEGPGQMWERMCSDYQRFERIAGKGKEKEKEEAAQEAS